jgi:hypothetical protein
VIFLLESGVMQVITIALLITSLWGLIDASTRRAETFEVAGKLTKKGWLLLLVLALGLELFPILGGIGLFAGAVITLVYLLDVRPAVAALTRKR